MAKAWSLLQTTATRRSLHMRETVEVTPDRTFRCETLHVQTVFSILEQNMPATCYRPLSVPPWHRRIEVVPNPLTPL